MDRQSKQVNYVHLLQLCFTTFIDHQETDLSEHVTHIRFAYEHLCRAFSPTHRCASHRFPLSKNKQSRVRQFRDALRDILAEDVITLMVLVFITAPLISVLSECCDIQYFSLQTTEMSMVLFVLYLHGYYDCDDRPPKQPVIFYCRLLHIALCTYRKMWRFYIMYFSILKLLPSNSNGVQGRSKNCEKLFASSCLSVRPAFRMGQLGFHWTDFH